MRRPGAALVAMLLAAACGEAPAPYLIAGPTAPARVVTEQPLAWDSREELLDWVANAVTRGPIAVEGEGRAAFIRVKLEFGNYVLRGPDLVPPAAGITGARVRARLQHDRPRHPQFLPTEYVELYFEIVNPPVAHAQASVLATVSPGDWQDLELKPAMYCCTPPVTVRYAFLPFRATTPSTLDIDRIELTR